MSVIMPIPTFEFCAFSFLNQWQEDERGLYNAFTTVPTEQHIRKALTYFQVARNFRDLKKREKTEIILTALNEVRAAQDLNAPHERVQALTIRLREHFDQNNISAASKLLWLTYREPQLIYDSRAVKALRHHFGHTFDESDYAAYSEAWRHEYAKCKLAIQKGVEQLPKGRLFMRSCALSDPELVALANEVWFTERVFDLFLWEIGAPR
jgi:hypothetical protein